MTSQKIVRQEVVTATWYALIEKLFTSVHLRKYVSIWGTGGCTSFTRNVAQYL